MADAGSHASGAGDELVINLLGDPEVRRGASSLKAFESRRLQSVLAFLIVGRDRAISRQRLAVHFWPDSTDAQARTNLRQVLHHLRHALGDASGCLRVDGHSVQWIGGAAARVDLVTFEDAAAAWFASGDEQALARAADAYGGDLLAGSFDEWVFPERDRLRSVAVRVLTALSDAARRRGDGARAIDVAERLVRLDPLVEASHRTLIENLIGARDRVRALRCYHECVSVLGKELGVGPAPETIALYRRTVGGEHPPGSGRATTATVRRTPFVGRAAELARLIAHWHDAAGGRARFALVAGEPGIGKSRLVEELLAMCRRDGAITVAARAYQAEDATPYGPMIEILRSDALRPALVALDPDRRRELSRVVLAPGVDLGTAGDPGVSGDRAKLFEAIAHVLVGPECGLVLGLDDLHWCDEDTFDLVASVLRSAAAAGRALLIVGTARQEELATRPELRAAMGRLHAAAAASSETSLERLDAAGSASLVTALAGDVPASTVQRIVDAAGGNPLFIVEMAQSGVADQALQAVPIPPRVQAVIDHRLDQLSDDAGRLVEVAAVVGRSFTIDLVLRLVPDQGAGVSAIDELWRRGIVREHGSGGYDFSHDRIRDVAYRRIGPARRRALHRTVADALEDIGGEPSQLAYHRERAGQPTAAIAAYRSAVAASVRAFAHQDVIVNCRRALHLVGEQPAGVERDEDELAFLVPLGVALMAGPGIPDEDLGIFERAQVLRRRRGLATDPSTLRISANAAIERRDYLRARRFGEILLRRGREEHDAVLLTEGHYVIGVTSFWLGELATSRQNLEAALAAYEPRNTGIHLERFGQDPRAVCLIRLALTALELGDAPVAAASFDASLDAMAEVGHEYTEVYVHMFSSWYLAERGDAEAAAAIARDTPPTANSTAPITRAQFAGWALTCRGDPRGGARALAEAVELARAGPLMFEPFALMQLATSRLAAGEVHQALEDAGRARAIAEATMPYHVPEATRLTGQLLDLTGADSGRVLALLAEAVRCAAARGAVLHELRARMALLQAVRAHVPADAPDHERMLRTCCGRLVGFDDLPDLALARSLLAGG